MSAIGGVAKRYARAFFEASRDAGMLDVAGRELEGFRGLLRESKVLRTTLENPAHAASLRKGIVKEVAEKAAVSELTRHFLCLVVDKGRIRMLDSICEAFHALVDESLGRARAVVTTARPPSPEDTERLRSKLERITGKTILAEMRVDPAILGGVIAQIGGLVVDGSVRARLAAVRASLVRGPA